MTILHIQSLISTFWNEYGQKGDEFGLMFKLADLLAEFYTAQEESKHLPQNLNLVK